MACSRRLGTRPSLQARGFNLTLLNLRGALMVALGGNGGVSAARDWFGRR